MMVAVVLMIIWLLVIWTMVDRLLLVILKQFQALLKCIGWPCIVFLPQNKQPGQRKP